MYRYHKHTQNQTAASILAQLPAQLSSQLILSELKYNPLNMSFPQEAEDQFTQDFVFVCICVFTVVNVILLTALKNCLPPEPCEMRLSLKHETVSEKIHVNQAPASLPRSWEPLVSEKQYLNNKSSHPILSSLSLIETMDWLPFGVSDPEWLKSDYKQIFNVSDRNQSFPSGCNVVSCFKDKCWKKWSCFHWNKITLRINAQIKTEKKKTQ